MTGALREEGGFTILQRDRQDDTERRLNIELADSRVVYPPWAAVSPDDALAGVLLSADSEQPTQELRLYHLATGALRWTASINPN